MVVSERLLKILSEGWELASLPHPKRVRIFLMRRAQLTRDVIGVSIRIAGGEAREDQRELGDTEWGRVRVEESGDAVAGAWPNYEKDIVRALEIRKP